ncbi:MAG: hypothetical protein FJ011_13585 [Chloroflexi bacterium]|nr:hypothetical protein [Chloroflexota bacterium]
MNLTTPETDLYYKLHGSLLAFANRQLRILPEGIPPDQIRKQPPDQVIKLRDACYAKLAILSEYLAVNPDRLSTDELLIVAGWRHYAMGDFYIMKHLKPYAVFMTARDPTHLYGVFGLYDPIEIVTGGAPLPLLVNAVLLPFRDRIIYDGLLNVYRMSFGPGIRSGLNESYSRAKEREGIVEALVGPDGQAKTQTTLSRKAPAKPAPDWRPAVDEIVAQTEKMRQTDTKLQAAAFGLLRAAASLAQASLLEQGADDEAAKRLKSARTAMTKVEKLLYEEQW